MPNGAKSESIVLKLYDKKVANTKDRYLTVEVGDAKKPIFDPSFKVSSWGGECELWLNLSTTDKPLGAAVRTVSDFNNDKKTRLVTPDVTHDLYIKDNGDFEWEIILPNKPDSNIFVYDIQTKGLEFYYQPELTQFEIDRGCIRPDFVVGSYAVYHSTRSSNVIKSDGSFENYTTGKAFHIYRPKIVDNAGHTIWGLLNIDTKLNQMTIEIDSDWLDNAVYPVTIDPTFGSTDIGESEDPSAIYHMATKFGSFTGADNSTLTSFHVYSSWTGTLNLYAGLFEDNGSGTNPGVLEQQDSDSINGGGDFTWDVVASDDSYEIDDAGGPYWLAATTAGTSTWKTKYDAGLRLNYKPDTGPLDNPWGGNAGATLAWILSIYITYTEPGAAETTTLNSDAHILVESSTTINSNTHITVAESTTLNSDSHVLVESSTTINSDAHILATETTTINSDSHITVSESTTINSDAEITTSESTTLNSDAHILVEASTTLNSDAHITVSESTTINSDAHITVAESTTINSDSHVLVESSTTINSDAHITTSETKTRLSNAHITTSETETVTSDSHILVSESTTINSNARISGTNTTTLTSNAFIGVVVIRATVGTITTDKPVGTITTHKPVGKISTHSPIGDIEHG